MTLLLCFPCWCSALVPELPQNQTTSHTESVPVLRQPLTRAREGQCLLQSGKGEGHLSPLYFPLPDLPFMQAQKSFGAQLLLLPFQEIVLLSLVHLLLRSAIVLPHWLVLMPRVEPGDLL